jgi:hypothetical protein
MLVKVKEGMGSTDGAILSNQVYSVKYIAGCECCFRLDGVVGGNYPRSRFIEGDTGEFGWWKCIDPDGELVKGAIYPGDKHTAIDGVLVGGFRWSRTRFVLVEFPSSGKSPVRDEVLTTPTVDEGARMMAFFKQSAHPNLCPSCAQALPCKYHP